MDEHRPGLHRSRSSDNAAPATPPARTDPGVAGKVGHGPLAAYRARVAAGMLSPDPAQDAAAERLDLLWRALETPAPRARAGWRERLGLGRAAPTDRPRGLYLVGEVGRGKSMLMDLFFAEATGMRKARIHFHRFMQDAHASIHAMRRDDPSLSDPIPPLADRIAAGSTLLCFDEFQINDIADALILGRLFEALFARGVVVVATSNVRPERLFQGRPGEDAFKPFIAVLLGALDTIELVSARDYRRRRTVEGAHWHVPADARADAALDDAFEALTEGTPAGAETLTVAGRRVVVPLAADGVARFDFDALCAANLGAGDYLAVARTYHTVLIDRVPRLGPDNFDLARRFIVLVDALYEARVKLFASAEAEPDAIYQRGENATAFERTASRLSEMRSHAYQALPHDAG